MRGKGDSLSEAARRGEFEATVVGQAAYGREHRSAVLALKGQAAVVFRQAEPGQFVQLACRDLVKAGTSTPLLRRPFSIAGVADDPTRLSGRIEGTAGGAGVVYFQVIYRIMGPGTKWLAGRGAGDRINLLGPLGHGFKQPRTQKVVHILVGGGVGLPPLFFLADRLAEAHGESVIGIAGARSGELMPCDIVDPQGAGSGDPPAPGLWIAEFARSGTPAIIATDDGSCGYQGTVVEALNDYLDEQGEASAVALYGCGPKPMLKALAELARQRGLDCQVCLEAYMACGIGLCQSCVVPVQAGGGQGGESYKLVCSHGPVFDAKEIVWEDASVKS